tara:strand:+ start:8371 stop:8790 length:420 start_codon:yes stop_codon:yes gene_type:complete
MDEYKPQGRGRPPKYFTEEQRLNAQKEYRKKWYHANKEKAKKYYNADTAKELRKARQLKGYYVIYSNLRNECYFGFSLDMTARCRYILKAINDQDKTGNIIDKFEKDGSWLYSILSFNEAESADLLDKIKVDWSNYTPI